MLNQLENKTKKTLIVTAHPSSHGFTHGIAHVLHEARMERGIEVEILDLYNIPLDQKYLKFENMWEIKSQVDPTRTIIQQKIKEADELIFIHPLWWMSMPAIMKNFLDNNITARFAYQYVNGKRYGLLNDKTAQVYITCDGPRWGYFLMGFPFFLSWICGTLAFCGMTVNRCVLIRNFLFKSDEERASYLSRLKKESFRQSILLRFISFIVRESHL